MTLYFKKLVIYVVILIVLPAICYAIDWHTPPDKWFNPRIFHSTFGAGKRIAITHTKITNDIEKHHYSDNKAYWFSLVKPDQMQSGPWSTIIKIFNERDYLINIKLTDHIWNAKVKWVNEKLIYIEVWWGRVLGSYLIYDVEKEMIIIKETVHDGCIPFQQYQQTKKTDSPFKLGSKITNVFAIAENWGSSSDNLESKLDKIISCDFRNANLKDVILGIIKQAGVGLVLSEIDKSSLNEIKITYVKKHVKAEKVLQDILIPNGLDYFYDKKANMVYIGLASDMKNLKK